MPRSVSVSYFIPGLLIVAALAILFVSPVHAATINVDSGCTLAQAFSSAINNTVPAGSSCEAGDATGPDADDVIVLTSDVTVSSSISIAVPGPRIFVVRESVRLEGRGRVINGAGSGI